MIRGKLCLFAILVFVCAFATHISAQNLLMFKSITRQQKEVEDVVYTVSQKKIKSVIDELQTASDSMGKVIEVWRLKKRILEKQKSETEERDSSDGKESYIPADVSAPNEDLQFASDINDSIKAYKEHIIEKSIIKEEWDDRKKKLQEIYDDVSYPTENTIAKLQNELALYDTVDFKIVKRTRKKLRAIMQSDSTYTILNNEYEFSANIKVSEIEYNPRIISARRLTYTEYNDLTNSIIDTLLVHAKKEYETFFKGQITIAAAFNKGRDASLSIKPNVKTSVIFKPANSPILFHPYISANVLSGDFDGRYDSGANLLIREASNFTFGLNIDWLTGEHTGLFFKAAYSLKRLADSTLMVNDSTTFYPVNNVGSLNANMGFELIPIPQKLSVYVGFQFMQVVSKDESYTQFFGENVKQHFFLPEAGIRVRFTETVFASLKVIFTNDNFRKLLGNGDDIIPVLKLSAENIL